MNSGQCKGTEERGVKFVPTRGSLIGGIAKEKTARITDAISDVQLAIDGLRGRQLDVNDGSRWATALGSFARVCSIFLRKAVLGDHGRRETRLLDDRVLASLDLRFDPLRRIPRDKRKELKIGLRLTEGLLVMTRLDDQTREPLETYRFRAGPQEVTILLEWPLPGAANWTAVPSEEEPWLIGSDQLFQSRAHSSLSCDDWLGQQVVLFDGKGISLKEIIRTVVNYEGAHSINVGRLATVEGEQPSKVATNPAPHILNAVTMFGIPYAHLIVIETALYLYEKLLTESSIAPPDVDIFQLTLGVACAPEQAESSQPDWLTFQGGMMISFSDRPNLIKHTIRAVS